MDHFLTNFAIEIGLFSLLGVVYYFYQKRKILRFEEEKGPLVVGYLLDACLSEKTDEPQPELDQLIEALDDFMKEKIPQPPFDKMLLYAQSQVSSPELKNLIHQSLRELQ